jgi:hypothetical protein
MRTRPTSSQRIRLALAAAAMILALGTLPAWAQSIICCNQSIAIGGDWIGSSRIGNCQDYFNSAPTPILRRLCQQRNALACLNTERCRDLPPEDQAPQDTPGSSGAALPSNPDRDGLEDGFNAPPTPGTTPPPSPLPRRLVYLIMGAPGADKTVNSFTVWLDHAACPLPLDANSRLTDSSAAKHVVRGKVTHSNGRVRIEAEAQQRPGGAKLGPFTAEAEGADAAAVTKATRDVAEKLKLVCRR